ncbi:hypothetical protein AM587_10007743 [Phytophthora nicotianae]|uniref:Uncharacterized protein n=1 Tax=Phytophthora nicotianae TaxID=4792 RepID=A0A0W8CD23_PHYNI|nr:hypothetical protein AM587_10007743 [Phytophthora nicotianae]
MSINVQLHEGVVPYLVSPYEKFFFLIHHVKLTVESGNGYPGQGGCFYGGEGRCYVSQYRLVFVADAARGNAAYQSFSLPFYGIRDWSFDSYGFDEFRNHVLPLLENSRSLHRRFRDLSTPSVLLLPGKLEGRGDGDSRRLAYYSADDPMTLFVVDKAPASAEGH